MAELNARLEELIQLRKNKGRYRQFKEYNTVSDPPHLTDFSSNDYLSVTNTPSVRSSYLSLLSSTPSILGSTGSRLLSGCTPSHSTLERRLATHFESPSGLLFNSGWDANVSFFSSVPQPSDYVIYDELVHASVHSGLRASRVPLDRRIAFTHNDPISLRAVLRMISSTISSPVTSTSSPFPSSSTKSVREPVVFLAVESLYSMDGDFAPLPRLLDAMDEHVPRSRQCVVVDEAHSTGIYGHKGRGVVHALGEASGSDSSLNNRYGTDNEKEKTRNQGNGRVGVRLMTFGKAVGCSGAILLCSPTVRSFLINFARPLIFSTALPHSTLIALHCVWDMLESDEGQQKRESLSHLAEYLHTLLEPLLFETPPHILRLPPPSPIPFPTSTSSHLPPSLPSPIHGLLTPHPHALSTFLLDRGFIVRPVVPPTVPPGAERVRICLRAGIEKETVARLVMALKEWVEMKVDEEKRGESGRDAPLAEAVQVRAKL